MRLRRQFTCNRYTIEQRWQAPLEQDAYRAIAADVAPLGVPPPATFPPSTTTDHSEIVLDGTALELRLRRPGWEMRRLFNHYERGGAKLSAVFRRLAMGLVPAADLPPQDWTIKSIC